MNVKFMNPFVEAADEVLKAECGLDAQRGNLTLQKSALTADDITVLVSLIGDVQGVVLYGLSVQTALALVSRVMGQEFREFDSLAQSGVAELGNVITGRATVKFSQAGFSANISPPTLIQGKGAIISTLDFARVCVPLKTEAGELMAHLALRESPPGMANTNFVPVALNDNVEHAG
ncbi:MAG: chemotaxis protein CheX [Chloroflexi bacterium]|nr:chemotaxis protein CheX [Chloroflexota bacterium]